MTEAYVSVNKILVAFPEKLRKLLAQAEIKTQTALAQKTGIDQGQISRFMNATQKPGAIPCLLFAALATDPQDRSYWLSICELSEDQRQLILRAIAPQPVNLSGVPHRWGQMLADILASGDREAISAVQQNLMVFHRIVAATGTAAASNLTTTAVKKDKRA